MVSPIQVFVTRNQYYRLIYAVNFLRICRNTLRVIGLEKRGNDASFLCYYTKICPGNDQGTLFMRMNLVQTNWHPGTILYSLVYYFSIHIRLTCYRLNRFVQGDRYNFTAVKLRIGG